MKKILAIGASFLAGIGVILAGVALYQKNKNY